MQKIDGLLHTTGRNASVHQQAAMSGGSVGHPVPTSVQSNGAYRCQIANTRNGYEQRDDFTDFDYANAPPLSRPKQANSQPAISQPAVSQQANS